MFHGIALTHCRPMLVGFNPLNIAGAQLWLDAADASTITGGATVSQWNDKSGLGRHVTQGTPGSRPTNGVATINGKNAIGFDGTDDSLLVPAALNSIGAGANTLFALYRQGVGGATVQRIIMGQSATGRYGLSHSNVNLSIGHRNTDATVTNAAHTKDTAAHVGVFRRSGTALAIWNDGATTGTNTNAEDITVTTSFAIGGVSSLQLLGDIAEIIIYNSSLNNAQINQVARYLAAKWGTTWTAI